MKIINLQAVTVVSITRDGAVLLSNSRAVAGVPLIPYGYLATPGNFIILTQAGDYPFYTQFGVTQTLIYLSAVEIGEILARA